MQEHLPVIRFFTGHVIFGVVTGAIAGYLALPFLADLIRINFSAGMVLATTLVGAAIGLAGGLAAGKRAERRAAARRDDMAARASGMGARFSAHDAEVQQALQSDFPGRHLHMQNVLRKDLMDFRLSIGDLSITQASRSTSGDTRHRITVQTAAYWRREERAFAEFSLQPGGGTHKLASAAGFRGLRFPEQPEFESRYFVLATDVDGTRALLAPQVLAWLVAHPGLNLAAGGHGLILYRSDEVLAPEALDGFVAEAAELFRLLERSSRQAGLKAAPPLTTEDSARAFAAQMPPSVARSIEKQLRARRVTRDDVVAFLRQKPPRKIPPNIAYRYSGSQVICLVGVVFAIVAGIMGPVFALMRNWFAATFIALFFIGGVALLFFGGRSWWRERNVLRRGELGTASVRSVEPAGWSDDDGEAFNVSASYQLAGQRREGRGTVQGRAVDQFKSLSAEGGMAPILYDPAHPERIVLVDALVNAKNA